MIIKNVPNFFADPMHERELALKATYTSEVHNGLTYNGVSEVSDPESVAKIAKLVGVPGFSEVRCGYRRYLKEDKQDTYIHNDVLISDFTLVVFLTLPQDCHGGLAFWRHKMSGWENQPTPEQLAHSGLPNKQEIWDQIYREGADEDLWEMNYYVPMHFNHGVLFWGPKFHSRYPKEWPGESIETARLIKVFFCKV